METNKNLPAELKAELKQLFLNTFNCYVDSNDTQPAMSEERAIEFAQSEIAQKIARINYISIEEHERQMILFADFLPKKHSWIILRTEDNYKEVNDWLNIDIGREALFGKNGYVGYDGCYCGVVIPIGYNEITTEQFKLFMLTQFKAKQ